MDIKMLLYILLMGIFVNNYVLQKFLGICPFLGVSKKFNQALGMGAAVIFVMLCATAVTWPIERFILGEKLAYLQTIVFILVIAAFVQLVEIVLKKFIPALYRSLAMVLFAGVRSRIENCPSPESVKGLPITLIAASIVSLAFFGFAGVIENLLGI